MSVWNRILSLPEEQQRQLLDIYNNNIPIEIRMLLAEWIEGQNWGYLAENNSDQINMMKRQLLNQFSIEIKNLIDISTDVSHRYKLSNYLAMINNPLSDVHAIIKNINDCLNYEKEFIRCHQEVPFPQMEIVFSNFEKLSQMIEVVKGEIIETENRFKNIKSMKETFNIKQLELSCYEIPNNNDATSVAMKQKLIESMNYLHAQYQKFLAELIIKYGSVLAKLLELSSILFDEINSWKQQQKNKTDSLENLIQLKNLSESMASNICNLLQQLKFIDALISNDSNEDSVTIAKFIELKKQAILLFKNLINGTFIVKNQPKQVIKKETKFNATVTLLAGSVLNVHMNSMVVRVQIINEEQAKQWYSDKDKFLFNSCCGEIVNNTTVMEYNAATNTLSANFVNLRLKSIKRAEKKATFDKVVDEKFALMFTTEIFLDNDMKFVISTISVPVVVIVHGNQKTNALSTILWDNSFSELKRCPFNVPTEVRFGDLAQVLSKLFYDHSRRHLSEDNMHFLAEKITGREVDKQHCYNIMIPWCKFSKDVLPDNSAQQIFTFWDWFYNILQLTREHLTDIWADGHIIGFLTRQRAETMLSNKPQGTFLLRFSDSQLGGISVAYKSADNLVESVKPYCSGDLKIRKLADLINDIDEFVYLYPDIPKDTAFSKYYTKIESQASNGYVFTQLKNCIPSQNEKESSRGNPKSESSSVMNDNSNLMSDLGGNMTNISCDYSSYDWNRNPMDDHSSNTDDFNYVPIMNDPTI